MTSKHHQEFLNHAVEAMEDHSLVRISFSGNIGSKEDLKSAQGRLVQIKGLLNLSITYRYKTRDIVKNYYGDEAAKSIEELLTDFKNATLFTTSFDLSLTQKGLKKAKPSYTEAPSLSHDKEKNRLISTEGKGYLQALSITDPSGKVINSSQDKYKQINRYVELLSPLLTPSMTKIGDMGSGKGYLTFALYDYLVSQGQSPSVMGVEYRQDMVDLCNRIAGNAGFSGLSFTQGTIENFDATGTDALIALHACDTATDDAIAKGIQVGAELIVVAPCCHKQIRREMEKSKKDNDVAFLTRHGIFMERQAEMATDGIRAMILEYFGYSVKVFEFISDSHTPKNVMITAQKKTDRRDEKILKKIKDAKSYFGIEKHHLERVLGI